MFVQLVSAAGCRRGGRVGTPPAFSHILNIRLQQSRIITSRTRLDKGQKSLDKGDVVTQSIAQLPRANDKPIPTACSLV